MKHIYDIASFCYANGVKHAILCPGSRSAPLAIAFMRYPHIKTYVIPDERSAAFIGLGIAQGSKSPVALICTSGTAALNFYPAITEAFYRNIPLLALTADRPEEWIDQLDGQTIRQQNVFKNHIRASYQFPLLHIRDGLTIAENTLKKAFKHLAAGPIHINIPFDEPFYPDPSEKITFSDFEPLIKENVVLLPEDELDALRKEINEFSNCIVVVGQQYSEFPIKSILENTSIPIITDVISNYRGLPNAIEHQDFFLSKATPKIDLVITFGLSVISKNLKLFLRKQRPLTHWHIGTPPAADTFRCLSKTIDTSPEDFFSKIQPVCKNLQEWKDLDKKSKNIIENFVSTIPFGEFSSILRILNKTPQETHVHLANSMPVRYVNYLSTKEMDLTVHANRGTSGIDGTLSTALGTAIAAPEKLHILFIGDLSLFYDRNGLWHPYIPSNLRIVLINNHGGGIFRMIDGPAQQPELEEYFVTQQSLKANYLAAEAGIEYCECTSSEELETALSNFFAPSKTAKLLEVSTDGIKDATIFKAFKALPLE